MSEDSFRQMLEADNARPKQSARCKCSSKWFDREESDYVVRCNRCEWATIIKGFLGAVLPFGQDPVNVEIETRRYDG